MIKKSVFLSALTVLLLVLSTGCDLSFSKDESEINLPPEDITPETVEEALGIDLTGGWRDGRDVATLNAVNNVVEWETLNVQAPTTLNRPGDREWIIARVEGSGYTRLLIMTMYTDGGVRSPSRILLDGPGGGFADGRFQLPLNGIARWRVESGGGTMRIFLNGREIWSASGNYTVDRAVMGNSPPRGFIGQWRAVQ